MKIKLSHGKPYPHAHPHGFIGGLVVGGLATLATVALIDYALDDARDQYKEETGLDMPKCADIPEERYVRNKKGEMDCGETKDGSQICFYKSGDDKRMCYIP